ncbi:type IV pilin protein [Snodgrassella alvi]|uniref:type IV pilin protein n=1 Tax=Snodgrassella alvi TaxID=1196083 RepID=UPI0029E5B10F|nr:prepilin-type N-terminal cleavage/methylation domain-containing protein [Snodgrassella alvi]
MQRQHYGFTMIDMMVTITIIAILAVIAYPAFNNYVIKTREQNARADLVQNINKLERYYSKNKTFQGYTNSLLEQGKSATYFNFTGIFNPNDYRLVASPTAANKGENNYIIYDSVKGMLLCEDQQQTNCDPF